MEDPFRENAFGELNVSEANHSRLKPFDLGVLLSVYTNRVPKNDRCNYI